MSGTLVVFDAASDRAKLRDAAPAAGSVAYLFPLTSSRCAIDDAVEALGTRGAEVRVLDAAGEVDRAQDTVRDDYIRFVAGLNGTAVPDRLLQDVFAHDAEASAWWYSLVAEKNTWKSDTLTRLVQLEAVSCAVSRHGCKALVVAIGAPRFVETLRLEAARLGVAFRSLKPRPSGRGLLGRLAHARRFPGARHAFLLLISVAGLARRTHRIRSGMRGVSRPAHEKADLLAVTYFPGFDARAGEQGVYEDIYYRSLQRALEDRGRAIRWLALAVTPRSTTLRRELDTAVRFAGNGTALGFIEEHVTPAVHARALLGTARLAWRYVRQRSRIASAHVFRGRDIWPLLRDEWQASFAGRVGYVSLAHYHAFRHAFLEIDAAQCLYPCEMHGWEKAMLDARDAVRPAMAMRGYQSGTVSRMLLNYFNDPSETGRTGPHALPGPDTIICDGEQPRRFMLECGWPADRVAVAEAVRYESVRDRLSSPPARKRPGLVVVALSIDETEGAALLGTTVDALQGVAGVELWVKPHPWMDLADVFGRCGIDPASLGITVKTGPLVPVLDEAETVVAGESSASIEALACGCRVIVLSTPEWINMSPLRGVVSPVVAHVAGAEELHAAVIAGADHGEDRAESARVVRDMLELDFTEGRPRRFLGILGEVAEE